MPRAARRDLLSLLVVARCPCWQALPEACSPEGGAERRCSGATGPGTASAREEPHQGALAQELAEVRQLLSLSRERLQLLDELEAVEQALGGGEAPGAAAGVSVRARLPLLAELTEDPGRAVPTAPSEDYLLSKAVLSEAEPLRLMAFLPLWSPGAQPAPAPPGRLAMPSALLVATTSSGALRVFSPVGELLLEQELGHDQEVVHLAVSPAQDLHMIATCDVGGLIRVHKVAVRYSRPPQPPRWIPTDADDEKPSIFLDDAPGTNVSVQFMRQVQVPDVVLRITALAIVINQGSMYLAAGDEEGRVSVFARGGAFLGKVDAAGLPGAGVGGLHARSGSLFFWAGAEWGHIALPGLKVTLVACPELEVPVATLAIDPQLSSRVILADTAGQVWVFRFRNRTACRVERRFPAATSSGARGLAPIEGFVLGLEGAAADDRAAVVALNMTPPAGAGDAAGAVVWRRRSPALRDWAVHAGGEEHGNLVALLSGDGRRVEILELVMSMRWGPEPLDYWEFLPLILIVVAAVVFLVGLLHCYLQHRRDEAEKAARLLEEAARKVEQAKRASAEAKRKAAAAPKK